MTIRYQLAVTADRLPKGRGRRVRPPHPYAVVMISGGPREGTEIGRTRTLVRCSEHADWPEMFFVETDSSVFMPIKVTVWNDRSAQGRDDVLLAEASFEASDVAGSSGHYQAVELRNGGNISISMEPSVRGNARGSVTLHLRGLDVRNVEPGLLGLGRSDPFFEIAKKNADHAAGIVRWNVVYRSDHVPNHLNPFFQPLTMGLEELCYCDPDWPLKISVWDHQISGKHRLIGEFETTLADMQTQVAVYGNADRERAYEIFKPGTAKSRGVMVVLKVELFEENAP